MGVYIKLVTPSRTANPKDRGLPLSAAVVGAVFFFILALLTEAKWPGLSQDPPGGLLLSLGVFLALTPLLSPRGETFGKRVTAIFLVSLCAPLLAIHSQLGDHVVFLIDARHYLDLHFFEAVTGTFLTALSFPAGVLATEKLERGILVTVLICSLFGLTGQALWFALTHLITGPTGMGYWLETRLLLGAGVGMVIGTIAGTARSYRSSSESLYLGGPIGNMVARLPGTIVTAGFLLAGVLLVGLLRTAAQAEDEDRFFNIRLDEYYVALSNLREAEMEGLAYPDLHFQADRARAAAIGATRSDSRMKQLVEGMLRSMEDKRADSEAKKNFHEAVLDLNRHLMKKRKGYFLEPHELPGGVWKNRFVLRYKVTSDSTISGKSEPVHMLRLRRADDWLVDTPFVGVSYPGIGTVLMDHIDDSALRIHGRLLAPPQKTEEEHKLDSVRELIRDVKSQVLVDRLTEAGHAQETLVRLGNMGEAWSHRIDAPAARSHMDAKMLAAFDGLAALLAAQTEIHEARHACDGDRAFWLSSLTELRPGPLEQSAVAETRAHLTEIIDGPLGPRYGAAVVADLLAGENARANAYLFASILIMEGLSGLKVRKPNELEQADANGSTWVELPMDEKNPGWLSYSRIERCHNAVLSMEERELRERARALWKEFFDEEYPRLAF